MNSTTQCHTFQTTWYMNILWYKGFLELEYLHILYLILRFYFTCKNNYYDLEQHIYIYVLFIMNWWHVIGGVLLKKIFLSETNIQHGMLASMRGLHLTNFINIFKCP